MAFFSFSIDNKNKFLNTYNIKPKQLYFSKNSLIWKNLSLNKNQNVIFLKRQKLEKVKFLGKSVLFFLPPNIGLGDAIEYAKAFKAIKNEKIFNFFGIAFTEKYSFIYKKFFKLEKIYSYVVSKQEIAQYDSLFHVTLEIDAFKDQKYLRSDIENEIMNYFNIKNKKNNSNEKYKKKQISKISIFPISSSPLRSMPIQVLSRLINHFKEKLSVEIFFDKRSEISNHIYERIDKNNISIVDSNNLEDLLNSINKIEYGVFMDSGPLHVAKFFKKRGVLIESSVSNNILLNNYNKITAINNNFSSPYCNSPCGLTNLFNFENNHGCYQTLKISKNDFIIKKLHNKSNMRGVKNNYIQFVEKPVGCLKSLDVQNILNYINRDLSL